jgi:hypothetical protein
VKKKDTRYDNDGTIWDMLEGTAKFDFNLPEVSPNGMNRMLESQSRSGPLNAWVEVKWNYCKNTWVPTMVLVQRERIVQGVARPFPR